MLYSFAGGGDGRNPSGSLIADNQGNLYGMTESGGGTGCTVGRDCGTVYKVAPDGTETILHAFKGGSDGADPYGGLLLKNGYLYGTASAGGDLSSDQCGGFNDNGCGTVFRLKK